MKILYIKKYECLNIFGGFYQVNKVEQPFTSTVLPDKCHLVTTRFTRPFTYNIPISLLGSSFILVTDYLQMCGSSDVCNL